MPTLTHALTAIERHMGFPISRGRTVAARLQEADYIQHGAPGVAPQITPDGFVALVIALAANKTLAETGAAVAAYLGATPGGVSLNGAPATIVSLRSELLALAETALEFPDDLADLTIEVVASWQECTIRHLGRTTRFVSVGADASHWQAARPSLCHHHFRPRVS